MRGRSVPPVRGSFLGLARRMRLCWWRVCWATPFADDGLAARQIFLPGRLRPVHPGALGPWFRAACRCHGSRGFGFSGPACAAGARFRGPRGGFGAKVLCGRRRDGAGCREDPRSARPAPRSGRLWATGLMPGPRAHQTFAPKPRGEAGVAARPRDAGTQNLAYVARFGWDCRATVPCFSYLKSGRIH